MSDACLRDAHIEDAYLSCANLSHADMKGANLEGAYLGFTSFADVDLRIAKGLETVEHSRPSPDTAHW